MGGGLSVSKLRGAAFDNIISIYNIPVPCALVHIDLTDACPAG